MKLSLKILLSFQGNKYTYCTRKRNTEEMRVNRETNVTHMYVFCMHLYAAEPTWSSPYNSGDSTSAGNLEQAKRPLAFPVPSW